MAPNSIAKSFLTTIVTRDIIRNCTRGDDGFLDEESCYVPFWYTKTGIILKWSLFLGFTVVVGLYLLLGYLHAKSRLRKGQVPLAYHRWLVSRAELARVDSRYQPPQADAYLYTSNSQIYGMQAMPPPVYDPTTPRPPMYEQGPPDGGATKLDPSPRAAEPTRRPADHQAEEYEAPAGPPPNSEFRLQGTGNSNPFRTS
ncbi:hypothetical protein B0T17DRAFT_506659 [Bombardia bombarda]|uniref:Uncharacterized protein n=1 Tax=Bombardia bombarda TaxID=252184 RepID=A0AA39XA57_9PEZI|nr:hypothetical protein B0T17DRAFT_506659 [Bombardia bombarda]